MVVMLHDQYFVNAVIFQMYILVQAAGVLYCPTKKKKKGIY